MSIRKAAEIVVFNVLFFFLGLTVFFVRVVPCKAFVINMLGALCGTVMMLAKIRRWRCIMKFAGNIGSPLPGLLYVLRHFVQTGIDYLWGYLYYESGLKLDQYFTAENTEIMDEAYERGKGVIVLSAHYGPMVTTSMLNNRYGNIKRPVTSANFERWDRMSGYTIRPLRSKMHKFLSDPKLSIVAGKTEKEMVAHVKKGGILFLHIDGSGPTRGDKTDFFGLSFSPHLFPFKLSLGHDVPVLFCSLEKKTDGGYQMRITRCNAFSSPREGYVRFISFLTNLIYTNPFSWLLLPAVCKEKD